MSLVNDMLRDLDDRKRKESGSYEAVPAKSKSRLWLWVLIIILVAVIAFLALDRNGFDYQKILSSLAASEEEAQITPSTTEPQTEPAASNVPALNNEVEDSPTDSKIDSQVESDGNRVTAIRWTLLEPHRGNLSFWLDTVKPFTLYEKTGTRLDIEIQDTEFAADLPPSLDPLLSSISFQRNGSNIRFVIEAKDTVEFKPELKQAPPRLKVEVIGPVTQVADAKASQPLINTVVDTGEEAPEKAELAEPGAPIQEVSKTADEVTHEAAEVTSVEAPVSVPAVEPEPEERISKGEWKKTVNAPLSDSSVVRDARRLLAKGRTDQAVQTLQSFVNKAKKSYQSKYLLTQLYMATGDYASARIQFETAPDNLSWALLKARAALQQGNAVSALSVLNRFPEGDSRSDYLELKAAAQQQSGQHNEAVQSYLQLLDLNSQQARWWVNLGVSFEYLGQTNKAVGAYQSALRIPGADPEAARYADQQLKRLLSSGKE